MYLLLFNQNHKQHTSTKLIQFFILALLFSARVCFWKLIG